jgi:hypothetical protein
MEIAVGSIENNTKRKKIVSNIQEVNEYAEEQLKIHENYIKSNQELVKRVQITIKDIRRRLRSLKSEIKCREKKKEKVYTRFRKDLRKIEHPLNFFRK